MNGQGEDKRESKVKVHKACTILSKEYLKATTDAPRKIDRLAMRVL